MSRIAKFLENELDRVNEYLSMAKASLALTTELCEAKCAQITDSLDLEDKKFVGYLNDKIDLLEAKIIEASLLVEQYKKFYFELQNCVSDVK